MDVGFFVFVFLLFCSLRKQVVMRENMNTGNHGRE